MLRSLRFRLLLLTAFVAGTALVAVALLSRQAVRAEYRGNTERALAAGVFGSPFYAFAGELFWGQDRLDFVERALVR